MAKPVGAGVNPLAAGRSPVVAPMVGDGMVGSPSVIIRETRQCWRVRRADRPRVWLAGVRASVVAVKRVMTVERRDAGRWQCEGPKDGKKNQRECPRGLDSGGVRQVPLAWRTPDVRPPHWGTRRRAAPSRQSTHRLESRMREIRPSGSEGGARSIPCPYPYRRERCKHGLKTPPAPSAGFYRTFSNANPFKYSVSGIIGMIGWSGLCE